ACVRAGGEGDGVESGKVYGGFDAFEAAGEFADAINHFAGAFERGGIGQLDHHGDVAFVLRGDEPAGDVFEAEPGQTKQAKVHGERDGADVNQSPHAPAVGGGAALEEPVEPAKKPAQYAFQEALEPVVPSATRLQQDGAE